MKVAMSSPWIFGMNCISQVLGHHSPFRFPKRKPHEIEISSSSHQCLRLGRGLEVFAHLVIHVRLQSSMIPLITTFFLPCLPHSSRVISNSPLCCSVLNHIYKSALNSPYYRCRALTHRHSRGDGILTCPRGEPKSEVHVGCIVHIAGQRCQRLKISQMHRNV